MHMIVYKQNTHHQILTHMAEIAKRNKAIQIVRNITHTYTYTHTHTNAYAKHASSNNFCKMKRKIVLELVILLLKKVFLVFNKIMVNVDYLVLEKLIWL